MKICVIMPSFLGEYPGAAKDRNIKFLRAVNSFIQNTYPLKHMVIVSDGCEKTMELYKGYFLGNKNIHCIQIPKQPLFSGNVRQAGIDYAKKKINPDIFCFLDSDDMILPNHISGLAIQFKTEYDWVYFDDMLYPKNNKYVKRTVCLEKDRIGTSNIAYRPLNSFSWKECIGYGHDWLLIQKLMKNNKYSKINLDSYIVCHNPNLFDN